MYPSILGLHELLRWVAVLLTLAAALRGLAGWARGGGWSSRDARLGLAATAALDAQVTVGLLLSAWLSPVGLRALASVGWGGLEIAELRFWAVLHPLFMLGAVALAHVGRLRTRAEAPPATRHRLAATHFGAAVLLVAFAAPWPGLTGWPPLALWP